MIEYAFIYAIYRKTFFRVIRFFVFITLFILVIFQAESSAFLSSSFKVSASYFLLFLMWEIFFRFKIGRLMPTTTVDKNEGKDIYSSFTLQALDVFFRFEKVDSIIKAFLSKKVIKFMLKKAVIEKKDFPLISLKKDDLARKAFEIAQKNSSKYVTMADLFASYILLIEPQSKLLFTKKLKPEEFLDILYWAKVKYSNEENPKINRINFWGRGIGDNWVSGWNLETKKYAIDFTRKVLRNPQALVGRSEELLVLSSALLKSKKQNAILVGYPGVGKTSIVSSFALNSFLGKLAPSLCHKNFYELSVSAILAGANTQGLIEERIKNILEELEHTGDVILYIPNIDHIMGGGGFEFDASGAFIQAVSGDKLQVIGTTTPENYNKFIERKGEFAANFEVIEVKEPDKNEAIRMLEEASIILEKRHGVNIAYEAIVQAVLLSNKYLADRFLPGKAIDFLDEAVSVAAEEKKQNLDEDQIIKLIELKTSVPVATPKKEEQELLLHLEDVLHKRIIDQDEAVKTVSQALRRLRVGISFENRPVGVFLFLGPTGVGKTELAKALASVYFKSEDRMITLDMGSYKDSVSVYRLIGSPPGTSDQPGELTEKVRENPFSLILLDEFEKASSNILDVFLSIFEDGRLTDSKGRNISFANTIIIATSNAGSELIREKLGEGVDLQKLKPIILDELQKEGVFKPELLNRFDGVILFEPLGEKEIQEVSRLLLDRISKKLAEQEIEISFDEKVIAKIAKGGYDQQFGARPIRRFIQDNIEEMLSQKMLRNEIKRGSKVNFSTDAANNITVTVSS
ncbi:MAG: ATP-dependent Clp protease ATP-binding subunit [Candidatus Levybacteria bacterium]|nr:ATP-dependent Clp protease ATP-binding subunit [Candidatus Levybacteria bacterium]